MKDELIRDRLVVGIRDSALSERLQLEPELTLDKAKKLIRQRESVRTQQDILQRPLIKQESSSLDAVKQFPTRQGRPQGGGGGQLGHFAPGPSLKGAPGGPMKGPLNTCLKDRNTLIEQSDLNTLIEQSQYSSEEQCSKLIDKEIWLVMGSYCHCQQVVTLFFIYFLFFFGLHLTTWVKGPTLTLCPGPLNFSGRPCHQEKVASNSTNLR